MRYPLQQVQLNKIKQGPQMRNAICNLKGTNTPKSKTPQGAWSYGNNDWFCDNDVL
jgi:hypothetical protein